MSAVAIRNAPARRVGTGRLIINGVWLDAEIETLCKRISLPSRSESAWEKDMSRLETLREIKDQRTEGYI